MTLVKLAFVRKEPEKNSGEPPIILLHGITSSKERWENMQQALADRLSRNVYAVDFRNHGESEHNNEFNCDILSVDLEHFMKSENIPKACLIGHSMGGLVAMLFALKAPEKVEKLVIEDMSPKEPGPELYFVFSAMISEQMRIFEESSDADTQGSMQRKLRESIYRTVPMLPDEDYQAIEDMSFQIRKTENGFQPYANLKAILGAIRNPPICTFPDNKVFQQDALFVYGGMSNFNVGEDKDLIQRYFPKAQFSCFENAGHEVCARYPSEFVKTVSTFV